MNFQIEDNLNINYDDWNQQMVDLEDDSNCPTFYGNYNDIFEGLALTEESYCQGTQSLYYSQGQKSSQTSPETENNDANNDRHHHQRYLDYEGWLEVNAVKENAVVGSYNCNFLNSSFDTLDDIESEHLFYQKSFTELTPVKCDTSNNVSPLSWASPNSVLSNSPSNSDLTAGLENFQENFQEITPSQEFSDFNQNNFNEEWLLQELWSNDSCQEFENETTAHDYLNEGQCQDSQIPLSQNNFENMFSTSPQSSSVTNGKTVCRRSFDNIFEYMEPENSTYSSKQDSFDEYKRQNSEILGESSWVKEIKVGKTSRPRGPKCWEFLLRLLKDSASNPSLVKWENPEIGSFKLVEKDKISAIWGNRPSKKKNGKIIKYESFARILRYHYKKGSGMVLPVSEKHLVYKFASKVMAAYRAGKIL